MLLAFQKPEQEEHEGNEGHEELLAPKGWTVRVRDSAWSLAFQKPWGEGHEERKEKEELQINGKGLCWHLGVASVAPHPQGMQLPLPLHPSFSRHPRPGCCG